MKKQNSPEIITIEDQTFGSHVEHWNLLTSNPATDVPVWLGQALDAPIMPMGLCAQESDMDASSWLIQGPAKASIQLCQVIAVENNKPKAVKTAFQALIVRIKPKQLLSELLPANLIHKRCSALIWVRIPVCMPLTVCTVSTTINMKKMPHIACNSMHGHMS